jgi:hypothetical protein
MTTPVGRTHADGCAGVPAVEHARVIIGWVSALLALEAAVDFSIDLRNHDPAGT